MFFFFFFCFFCFFFFFFFNDTATTEIYTLSLHDALPICPGAYTGAPSLYATAPPWPRSEEHTSELQSPWHLVCRLLLEKKKKKKTEAERVRKIELRQPSRQPQPVN